jgi:zinc protease
MIKLSVLPALALAAAPLLASGPAVAQDIRFDVKAYKIENGLRILALEDHSVPTITYYTFFHVGSRDETVGRTGISHLFEHMMFNGAKKYGPGAFDRLMESRGGYSNAFTREDLTAYHETFPADALEQVIDMEADRMSALQLTEESLKTEREVVKEERRLRTDNDIFGGMYELLRAQTYLAHPYHWSVVGWMADLDAITLKDCQDYFRVHYAPNNATIVIVGDFKAATAIDLIGKAYGSIAAQPLSTAVVRSEPPQQGERRAILRRPAQAPAIAVAYHTVAASSPDLLPLDLLQILLGGGDSSRLTRSLVYEKELATSVAVENELRIDPSDFVIYAEAKPGVTAEALEAALNAEVDRLGREEVSDAELQKAKNIRTTNQVKALKTTDGKAEQFGDFDAYFGDYQRLFTVLKRYDALTKSDLKAAAARYLRPDNRTVVTLMPAPAEGGAP